MEPEKTFQVLGMMSGTSLDGLDLVICELAQSGETWRYTVHQADTLAYPKAWEESLKNAVKLDAPELLRLHSAYGTYLGEKAGEFLADGHHQVDFIASHGHTVFHQPERGFTFQLGAGQTLANAAGLPVICDFRSADVALGGQGAPLVPIGDRLLFGAHDYCLNLGGIANISFEKDGRRIAYDIAPANMLLNYLVKDLPIPFDKDGSIAAKGKVDTAFLAQLNGLGYYRLPYPKSMGWEWFDTEMVPLLQNSPLALPDQLRTAVQHIAQQVANAIQDSLPPIQSKLLVTGGGAKHLLLIEILRELVSERMSVTVPDPLIIDFKEAIVFALLGVLKSTGQVNCLASVTGARTDSCGGQLFHPM